MRKRKHVVDEEVNYWQSSADMMTGLVLVLLLVILLLGLMMISDHHFTTNNTSNGTYTKNGAVDGNNYNNDNTSRYTSNNTGNQNGGSGVNGGHSNGGGTSTTPTHTNNKEEYEREKGSKSAVLVKVIDGDSKKAVQKKGITFQLYQNDSLLSLNSYYPTEKTYTSYQTDNKGTFYLPEMIDQDHYVLKNIKVPNGYDLADDKGFTIRGYYEYSNPYIVKVKITASKNSVRIRVTDEEGKPVEGAAFTLYAKKEVKSLDGTIRYKAGQKITTITTNEKGQAKSRKVFLGQYTIKETTIPGGYVKVKDQDVNVLKKTTTKVTTDLTSSHSQIIVRVLDTLTSSPLSGVSVKITHNGTSTTETTNVKGQIVVRDLKKNTTYSFKQTSHKGSYLMNTHTYKVKVDQNGYINGQAHHTLFMSNKLIRVNISVKDQFLRNTISGQTVTLLDAKKNKVKTWTSTATSYNLMSLRPGVYYIQVGSKTQKITVTNSSEKQAFTIGLFTTIGLIFAIGTVIAFVILVLVVRYFIRTRKGR